MADNRVEITSQNHNYAVPVDSLPGERTRITHISLNDRTVEGLEVVGRPVYSVQFHPEAAPGPRDSHHLFRRFRQDMAARRKERSAAAPASARRGAAAGAPREKQPPMRAEGA
jgi:carbamoyl-phosphate synthase small subunit